MLACQRRARCGSSLAVLRKNITDPEAREPFATLVAKDGGLRTQVRMRMRNVILQDLRSLRPQRTDPCLASLPEESDLSRRVQLEINDIQIDDLLDPRSRVEQERQ